MAPSSAAAKEEMIQKAQQIVVDGRDNASKVISVVHDIVKRTISPDSECATTALRIIEPAAQYLRDAAKPHLELTNNYIRHGTSPTRRDGI
ncbi:hypothetical protein GJ744_011200 [Endocarpon pusillum]|uniref:Uncharacterized protein n=1 Tax=Endocarpon pusillum TaxID=364733 RepID=A0A8H7AG79_9EURO|nr:hypothetical protein GJ744_011200 [Endocarpon pusillum]